jgi:hypothetical protein
LGPIFASAALVGAMVLLMVAFRNYAILRGNAEASYFARYASDVPPDWVERPTRTFNNLMQIPNLFWCVCILMMVTQTLDAAQVVLAWIFVFTRVLHAIIYTGWNYLPARFGTWMAGVITLSVLWIRFAIQAG